MTDRATISVVPCAIHNEGTFWVVRGGQILWPTAPNETICCASESEANSKADSLATEYKAGERRKGTTPLKGKPLDENGAIEFSSQLASTPAQAPIQLNSSTEELVKSYGHDRRLWTTDDTTEFNLRVFARAVLAANWCALTQPQAVATRPVCKCGHDEPTHRVNIGRRTEIIFTGCYGCECDNYQPTQAAQAVAPEPVAFAEHTTTVKCAPPEGRERGVRECLEKELGWAVKYTDLDMDYPVFTDERIDGFEADERHMILWEKLVTVRGGDK